jgi:hypothetical protein
MISENYVDGLELRIKELTAELNKYKEIARQHTELASKGIYYTLEELYEHDKLIAKAAYRSAAYKFTENAPWPNRDWTIDFSANEYVKYLRS